MGGLVGKKKKDFTMLDSWTGFYTTLLFSQIMSTFSIPSSFSRLYSNQYKMAELKYTANKELTRILY